MKACEAEIEDLDVTVLANHDVLGFDIAVNNAGRMRHAERLRDLPADVLGRCRRQPASHDRAQCLPGNELEGQKGLPVGHAHVVDRDDIGMVQRAGGPGLEFEPAQLIRIVVARQQFQSGVPSEPRVLDQEHLTHRSGA